MAREEAKRLGLKLIERHVKSVDELRKALQEIKTKEADAFFYLADALVVGQSQLIIDTAKAKKLPAMLQDQSLVAKGGLASYGQNYFEIGRISAKYVQRVLSGTPPKDIKDRDRRQRRAGDQFANRETTRRDDSAASPGARAEGDQVKTGTTYD